MLIASTECTLPTGIHKQFKLKIPVWLVQFQFCCYSIPRLHKQLDCVFRQAAAARVGKNITSKQQWSTVTGLRVMCDLTIVLVNGEELQYQHEYTI